MLDKFREKDAGQMEIKELWEARKTDKQQPRREGEKSFRSPSNKELKKPFKLNPKFDNYTRFNTKREDIIKEILHAKIVKPPNRAGNYQDQRFVDRTKYCAFHQKFGHTTDECITAKDLLEWLARKGLLNKYVDGRKNRGGIKTPEIISQGKEENVKRQWANPSQQRGLINCISGGFANGGTTNSAQKWSYREMLAIKGTTFLPKKDTPTGEITFTDSDCKSTSPNLDDPVVISVQVGDLLDELIATAHADHKEARRCYHASLKQQVPNKAVPAQVQAVYNSNDLPLLNELNPREEF
nr:uncharacterized protein LOC112785389 [Arachis hypogaea]